ncbi:50S ribosomal protein L25/general stress protein Ctc [Thiohalomonas denitrificans]|uniref:Large ribosomal subunit protein bL25 n=1 Tax=Thiohalomonas denitrificans TaxID=415747 RepID=A0A1G5Q8M1_9GAMM|nr:50S ribosomal protein L25/general stress protein Ctc [Thiohalomonas denitrificans]SCZ57916.1 large subunit ribosomal protein L25 [Thiohalomonas denitrificans]
MSEVNFNLTAEVRSDKGKGASRRLRRTGKMPAILYGTGQEPTSIVVDHDKLMHNLEHEAFYSHVLTITVDGKEESAVLKDLQRHPAKNQLIHADFQRVSANEKLRMHVPLHFIGEDIAPGVKIGSGLVTHTLTDVEVLCLPKDLPEYIEADLSRLELGQSLHLSELIVPEGVELVELMHGAGHDLPVAQIQATRASVKGGAGEEAEDEGEEAAE